MGKPDIFNWWTVYSLIQGRQSTLYQAKILQMYIIRVANFLCNKQ